jgi:hypothetical protein
VKGLGGSGHTLAFPTAKKVMLSNEVFALACRKWYAEQGLIVDASNGQFAHSPLPRKKCDTGYYLLWGHHQHQGLLQSKDTGECCFFSGDTKKWLLECDYFPDNYFELWDIYDEFLKKQSRETGRRVGKLARELKLGIHDPVYRSSEEYLSMRRRESKKLAESEVGMFDPEFKRKLYEDMSKPIVLIYPDGGEICYCSRSEAIRKTGISSSTLVRVLCNGKAIRCGRFQGVRVRET